MLNALKVFANYNCARLYSIDPIRRTNPKTKQEIPIFFNRENLKPPVTKKKKLQNIKNSRKASRKSCSDFGKN